MPESPVYRPHDEAPAYARLRALEASGAWKGVRAHHFEYVSRGDFVVGRIYLSDAAGRGPIPLVLLAPDTAESAASESLEFAADWVRQGQAVAILDLPLHGQRASPKLSERLFQGIRALERGERLDADTRALVEEFTRQSTSDVIRGLDALTALDQIDVDRIALVGLGLGGVVCGYVVAHDERPIACVYAGGTARFADPDLDAAKHLANRRRHASCSTLFVTGARTSEISADTTRAFYDAAPEPKQLIEVSAGAEAAGGIAPEAASEIARFLARHLGD